MNRRNRKPGHPRPARPGRWRSLRPPVMAWLGTVSLLTLLVIEVSVGLIVNSAEQKSWRGRQGEAAQNAAQTVGNFIRRAEDTLALVGLVDRSYLEQKTRAMQEWLQENPALLEVVRLDASGRVLASSFRDRSVLASMFTLPQSEWFLQAKAGQHYFSTVQLSSGNEPYIIMAVPAPDGGSVATRLRMDVLWSVVSDIRFGVSGRAYLVNREGQIIAHTNRSRVDTSVQGIPEIMAALHTPTQEWYGEYVSLDRGQVVGATAAVPGTDWIVVTELAQEEAFTFSRSALIVTGLEMSLLTLATMFASGAFLKRLIFEPVERLRTGAERIGQGDLDYQLGITNQNEIGQVTEAFNQMVTRLKERDQQIAARTQALAAEVAERKRAEVALRQAHDELELRVKERTAQLAQANQELRRTVDRQTLLYQVLRAMGGQLDPNAVTRLAVDAIVEFTGWPHICFAVPNEAGSDWVIQAAGGELAAEVGLTCPISQGVIGRVFRTNQTQLVEDVRADPDYKGENPVLLSELTVPIKQGEHILAVLNLESDKPAAFGADEVQLAESLDVDFRTTGSLGLKLVATLVDQLEGSIELDRSEGTTFKITFVESLS